MAEVMPHFNHTGKVNKMQDSGQSMPLLSAKQVAVILGCHVDTLRRWRIKQYGPSPVRVGRKWKYKKESVDSFLNQEVSDDAEQF